MNILRATILSFFIHLVIIGALSVRVIPEYRRPLPVGPLFARIVRPESPPLRGPVRPAVQRSDRGGTSSPARPKPQTKKTVPPAEKPRASESPEAAHQEVSPEGEESPEMAPAPQVGEGVDGEEPQPEDVHSPSAPPLAEPSSPPSGRQLLDRDIIGEIARRYKPEREERPEVTFDVRDLMYEQYLRKLKFRIESIWVYPPEAARRGIYGDLYIRFTIKKDGRLGDVELIRTSGYRELDEAALQALRDGQPYWPLPESWGVEALTITGHFIYTIYGMFIR